MVNIGNRYSLGWRHPHRIEATIVELHDHVIVADVVHRCDQPCYLRELGATLPIEGRLPYKPSEFERLFVPMAPVDALALPGGAR